VYCLPYYILSKSPRRPGIDPTSVRVRFVVNNVTLWRVLLPVLLFLLSVSFHRCSTFNFTYMLNLPERMGKVWESSNKQCSSGNGGVLDRQVPSLRSGLLYGEINRFQKAWTDRDTGDARSFPFIQVAEGWGRRNVWSGMHVAASVTKSDNDQLQPIEQPSVATSRSTTPVYGSVSVLAACTSYDGFMQISYFTSKAQWSLYVPHSGHYMYHQFNIHISMFCPHSCIYVFCVDLRTNSDYFPIQH